MRKLLFLLLLSGIAFAGTSQQNQVRIDEYMLPNNTFGEKQVIVGMPFGKYSITNITGDTTGLFSAGEVMIDIICTDYPSSASLEKLNQKRLYMIMSQFPFLSKKNIRRVNFLRQLNGGEKYVAQLMFHGVVIRFRPAQTKETMKKDLAKLEEMLGDVIEKTSGGISGKPKTVVPKYDGVEKKKSPEDTTTLPGSVKKSWYGVTSEAVPDLDKRNMALFRRADSAIVMTPFDAHKKGLLDRHLYDRYKVYPKVTLYFGPAPLFGGTSETIDELDSLAVVRDSLSASGYSINPKYPMPDSTLFKVFKRNNWKNTMVVGDVTGSMYPYTAQLLIWLKLHLMDDFTNQFAFFNDGDATPDDQKKIGSTGGIYFKKCSNYEEAKELVQSTMMKGGGGDCPENNIEALLLTEKNFPDNNFQVLIADNWAPIKDMTLITQLTKPVRIVLCGAGEYGINVDYLNLARKTKGSVHLMEEDLNDLASLHEGEIINIGRLTFKITDGEFRQITGYESSKSL